METIISNHEVIKKYENKIQNIKNKLKDLTSPLKSFEKYYKGIIKKNYYSNGKLFDEGGWQDLNEDYYEWKLHAVLNRLDLGDGKVACRTEKLRLTDTLRKEVFSDKAVTVTKDKIQYNLYTVYARIHQLGGQTNFGTIPPRPYLYSNKDKGLRKQDVTMYYKILEKYLLEEAKWIRLFR